MKTITSTLAIILLSINTFASVTKKEACDAYVTDLKLSLKDFKRNPGIDFEGYYNLKSVKFNESRGLTQEQHDERALETYLHARKIEKQLLNFQVDERRAYFNIGVDYNENEGAIAVALEKRKILESVKIKCLLKEESPYATRLRAIKATRKLY